MMKQYRDRQGLVHFATPDDIKTTRCEDPDMTGSFQPVFNPYELRTTRGVPTCVACIGYATRGTS